MSQVSRVALPLVLLTLTAPAFAHHSFFGRFNTTGNIELEGDVTAISWRNPHAHIYLNVRKDDGRIVEYDLESGSPTLMTRAGIPADAIKVGDHIRVAGYPPTTNRNEAFATNVLLPSGQELVMQTGAKPHFGVQSIGDFSYRFRTVGDRSEPELGLFRVWTFTGSDGFLFPESINRNYDLNQYPMTDAARAALAKFNPVTDNPTNNCTPKGMPLIMEQPLPMEIVRQGNDIAIRIEEYDLTRVIHMNERAAPANTSPSPLGYSIGSFDGETLVVTTTHISWPHFNQAGIPQSQQSVITERFSATEGGSVLAYAMTVNDPVNFTKPVELSKKMLYIPTETILPFECSETTAH
jgi:predicted transcriptional regulator